MELSLEKIEFYPGSKTKHWCVLYSFEFRIYLSIPWERILLFLIGLNTCDSGEWISSVQSLCRTIEPMQLATLHPNAPSAVCCSLGQARHLTRSVETRHPPDHKNQSAHSSTEWIESVRILFFCYFSSIWYHINFSFINQISYSF